MILSDRHIKLALRDEMIGISPYRPERLQPASYDLSLGGEFIHWRSGGGSSVIDMSSPGGYETNGEKVETHSHFIMNPGEFVLACTEEVVMVSDRYVARLEGKSSIARIGLMVHVTAGFVDPGWSGVLTLELVNLRDRPVRLWVGQPIAQVSFYPVSQPVEKPYNGSYVGSKGVVPSRFSGIPAQVKTS